MYFNSYIPTNSRDVLRNMYGFKMENNKSNLIVLDAEKNLHGKSFDFGSETCFNNSKFLITTSIPQLVKDNKAYAHGMKHKSKNAHGNILNCYHFRRFIFKKTRTETA